MIKDSGHINEVYIMKNKFRFLFSFFVSLVFLSIGCSGVVSSSDSAEIIMTTKANSVKISMTGTGWYTIYWGDGDHDTGSLDDFGYEEEFHTFIYTVTNSYTIKIVGGAITGLDCIDNQLTSLNVSGCTSLEWLDCFNNQLTLLNVSGCTSLEWLDCSYNILPSLDVRDCMALTYLDCSNNKITRQALENLFEMLIADNGEIYIGNNTGTTSCDKTTVVGKGWTVYY